MNCIRINRIAGLVVLVLLMTRCSEDFLDRSAQDVPNPGNFFSNEASARAANGAIYNFWSRNSNMMQRDMHIIFDGMTDDSHWRTNRNESVQQREWNLVPTHGPVSAYWQYVYRSINAANFSIEGIPNSASEAFVEQGADRYVAEARFMRGFNYLFLVTFFGDVPLILETLNSFEEYSQPRTPKAEIYQAIIADFQYAKDNLPDSWPTDYTGRPTRATAAAYLAKAFLYMEDYPNAETAAIDAIAIAESTGYGLYADYEAIFDEETENNEEILFAFQFVHGADDYGTNAIIQVNPNPSESVLRTILGPAWGYALPQRSLYDEYEPDDPRRGYTIWAPGDVFGLYNNTPGTTLDHFDLDPNTGDTTEFSVTYNTSDPVMWQHYWTETGMGCKKLATDLSDLSNPRLSGKDIPMMRMADLYLIAAEALAEQGDATALNYVDAVRARESVDLPGRTVGDGRKGDSDLVSIVRHERRVELAMEGQRLYDVMRWKIVDEIFNGPEPVKKHFYSNVISDTKWDGSSLLGVKYDQPNIVVPKHYLFPVPQGELDQNEFIKQNNPEY